MDEMEKRGALVNRNIGVAGSGILSYRRGIRRKIDLALSLPRMIRLVLSLKNTVLNYSIVYVHGYRELLLVALASYFVDFRRRPAIVWHCHGLGDSAPPTFLVYLANQCRTIIAISKSVEDRLVEIGVNPGLISVVHNAALTDQTSTRLELPKPALPLKMPGSTTILLPSSSIREDKGIRVAIEALSGLPDKVQLWITGDPGDQVIGNYVRSLRHLIDRKKLSSRVYFIGRRSDIHRVMQVADIVLVPSLCREGFGLVAAEAMLLGKPVIVSNRGALPEVVGSSECGWIFDPSVPGNLETCVLDILNHPHDVEQRSVKGRKRAEKLFGFERWVETVTTILRQVGSDTE